MIRIINIVYLLMFSSLFTYSCALNSKSVFTSQHKTSIVIDSIIKHFSCGQEQINIYFEVKNTGKNPLIFIDCKTSCGCFVADCPKDAVEPGKTVKIRSRFSGIGREGAQEKSLVLHCNTKTEFHILRINGFVRKD